MNEQLNETLADGEWIQSSQAQGFKAPFAGAYAEFCKLTNRFEVENYEAICPRHGKYIIPRAIFMFNRLLDCKENACTHPECQYEHLRNAENREALARAQQRQSQINEALSYSNIPTAYLHKKVKELDTSSLKQQAITYIKNFDRLGPLGKGLTLYGSPGTGKTHTACAILRALMPEVRGRYTTVAQLIATFKSVFDYKEITEKNVMDFYVNETPLLVIDEIGVQSGTNFELTKLNEVIINREAQKLPTIYVTNLTPSSENPKEQTLQSVLGARLYDRLVGSTVFVKAEGSSHRLEMTSVEAMLASVGEG